MAKPRRLSLTIHDVKTFREMSYIKTVVDTKYNGVMPLDFYKGFLRVITNPELKAYFIRNFKPKSYVPSSKTSSHKKRKNRSKTSVCNTQPAKESLSGQESPERNYQNEYTVKAVDFNFVNTIKGPYLVFRNHKAFCSAESQWFNYRILRSIDRTFQIRISDYLGFSFVPYSDKQVFLDLLKQKYVEFEQQIYQDDYKHCFQNIKRYLDDRERKYVRECQKIQFEITLDDLIFNEEKQVYNYQFNALKWLGITKCKVKFHVPLSDILQQFDKSDEDKFYNEIIAQYPDGYHTVINLDKIFPHFSYFGINIEIPKIFITRFGEDNPIGIKAVYYPCYGRFIGIITSEIPSYQYLTETSEVVFAEDIKESIINILRNIDDKFIITFYTAFRKMFNEHDSEIQSIYDKQSKLLKSEIQQYEYYWSRHAENNRYMSGYSPLMYFDENNTSDWMWLTTQMKNGVFLNAYAFKDKDETLSSKYGDSVRRPVKVYLTVEDASYSYKEYTEQSIYVEKIIISMYALDTTKSTYRFEVEKDKINEAIFFIWSYFSSNNYNKRQDFDYILSLKEYFGIKNFYKDKSLDYHSGIGYCDATWFRNI